MCRRPPQLSTTAVLPSECDRCFSLSRNVLVIHRRQFCQLHDSTRWPGHPISKHTRLLRLGPCPVGGRGIPGNMQGVCMASVSSDQSSSTDTSRNAQRACYGVSRCSECDCMVNCGAHVDVNVRNSPPMTNRKLSPPGLHHEASQAARVQILKLRSGGC